MRALFFALLVASIQLGCSDASVLGASPATLDFGAVPVGAVASRPIEVSFVPGTDAASVVVEPADGPFSLAPGFHASVAVGAGGRFEVRFQPTEVGAVSGSIELRAGGEMVAVSLLGEGAAGTIDGDRDGVPFGEDCDDSDPSQSVAQEELCDGLDGDCDGEVPADEVDGDADGAAPCAGDCDDADPKRFPGATELCDGFDSDCDGDVGSKEHDADGDAALPCAGDCDDADPLRWSGSVELCDGGDNDCDATTGLDEVDLDLDGALACAECDDSDPTRVPGSTELCDGVDGDCDPATGLDEVDLDLDGALACLDCDDGDGGRAPGLPELCDGVDGDCDGLLPAEERDVDLDGARLCVDCDDAVPTVFPGAPELCNGLDDDCDLAVPILEEDLDGDGSRLCDGDCDAAAPEVWPGAPELCDGVDQDCDGAPGGSEVDVDGDGFLACDTAECDDADSALNGGALDLCFDVVDQDCDGAANDGCSCPRWLATTAGPCPADGSLLCPFADPQAAFDAAAADPACSLVMVLPGTYGGGWTLSGVLSVAGLDGAAATIFDGGGGQRVFEVPPGAGISLSGLTITGGLADEGAGLFGEGASLSLDAVTVEANDCAAEGYGAGLFCEDCSPFSLTNSIVRANHCGYGLGDEDFDGGGIYLDGGEAIVDGVLFEANLAGDGSAFWSRTTDGTHTIQHNTFVSNHAGDGDGDGGEVEGGTLVVDGGSHVVRNNLFIDNLADGGGGALVIADQGPGISVTNNVMVYNDAPRGAGLHVEFAWTGGSAEVVGNVFAGNTGYGYYAEGVYITAFVYNVFHQNSTAWGSGWIWPGSVSGTNFAASPGFVATSDDGVWANEDLHLAAGSACVDAGSPDSVWMDVDASRQDVGGYGGPNGGW